jgi:polar amino acid transport system substrate-binding protein
MRTTGRISLLRNLGALLVSGFLMLSVCPVFAKEPISLVTLDFPPYSFEENGAAKGIAVDIVKEVFARMGFSDVSISLYPWGRGYEMAKLGQVDGIFTIYWLEEREPLFFFSNQELMSADIALFALKDRRVKFDGNLSSLKGMVIGTAINVSLGERFDQAVRDGSVTVEPTIDNTSNALKLLAGRVPLIVANRYVLWDIFQKLGSDKRVQEIKPPVQAVKLRIAFSKKRPLEKVRDDFDNALARMKREGRVEQIIRKYIHRQ